MNDMSEVNPTEQLATSADGQKSGGKATTKTEVRPVTMTDGRLVEFTGKTRMYKESFGVEEGGVTVIKTRFDFENGETRTYTLPQFLLHKAAAHGYEQKLGDEVAGLKNETKDGPAEIDDVILTIDSLAERLASKEDGTGWTKERVAGDSMAGTSILFLALCEYGGATSIEAKEQVKAYIKSKSAAEKAAIAEGGLDPKIAEIVQRIRRERLAKNAPKLDVEAELAKAFGAAPTQLAQ